MAVTKKKVIKDAAAPSRGRFVNTGNGPTFQPIDIGHRQYMAVIEPDTAFWSLVDARKNRRYLFRRRTHESLCQKIPAVRAGDG